MYKFILYNVELLQIKQKNRTIIKKVYRYIMTINNIDNKDISTRYVEIYSKYIHEFNNLAIHVLKENENDYLLNNCYVYDDKGDYKKYYYEGDLI